MPLAAPVLYSGPLDLAALAEIIAPTTFDLAQVGGGLLDPLRCRAGTEPLTNYG